MCIDHGTYTILFQVIPIVLCTHILIEDITRQFVIPIVTIEHIAVIDRTSMVAERFTIREAVSTIKMGVQLRTLLIEVAIEEITTRPIREVTQQRHEM